MALTRVKTWISETLTAADLNAEFNNILNNPYSLISPFTSNVVFNDNIKALFGTGSDASIYYNGTNLYINPTEVGSGNLIILGGKSVFIFDSANAKMTTGLTINQGGADDEILALKSSDVAHGRTDDAETDTYGLFKKAAAGSGGLAIIGFSDTDATTGNYSLFLGGYTGDTALDTTKSTAGLAAIIMAAAISDGGTTVTTPGANENLLVLQAGTTTRFILDSDGDSHQDVGTAWTNFSTHDDLALLTALSVEVSKPGDPIRERFGGFMDQYRDELQALRIVTFNDDGHHFVNWSRMHMLQVGALMQIGQRLNKLEERLG